MSYLLDTHTLVWRFIDPKKIPPKIQTLFSNPESDFLIPTICLLEIQYLVEVGRIQIDLDEVRRVIQEEDAFQLVAYDESVMLHSLRLTTTRDPFDRIILAHALSTSTKIITRDLWMKRTAPHLVVF